MDLKSSKIESKWGHEGAGKVKNGAKRLNMEPTWRQRGEYLLGGAFWSRKSGQHGRKMGSHIEPKSMKNRCRNRSKKRCLSRSIFGTILVDFLMENGNKLAPKRDQNRSAALQCCHTVEDVISGRLGDWMGRATVRIRRSTVCPYCKKLDPWAAGR